ncbi:MAG: hypothetical protein KBT33_00275 [Prevotellaceae bacterium]|nr:hypothetical protein [Candidatus Minthosoma equi]
MIVKHYIYRCMLSLAAALVLTGCSESLGSIFGEGGIEKGDPVMFTTMVPEIEPSTRSAKEEWEKKVKAYKAVQLDYTFNVEMWKKGDGQATASNKYSPKKSTNEGSEPIANYDGTLQAKDNMEMYWQDNVNRWGFKATSESSQTVEAEQNSQSNWLRQDKLIGYSYMPLWIENEDRAADDFNAINYRTNKEWYADNKKAKDLEGLMVESDDDYKKIPLYMQHERSWITIILRAGEGVAREALAYATSDDNIKTSINSFASDGAEPFVIDKPWSRETFIDYVQDKNGAAKNNVSTTRYDAIVMPHNYAAKKEEEIIAKINLSNQIFSFYASNDSRYFSGDQAQIDAADKAYNLEAGKHLTIEATLSRESRKILITAWIQDWTEVATQTICDDYGQNGDPIVIKDRDELIAFLRGSDNKSGSVAIIQPTELNLDIQGSDWPQDLNLNATLNLAGCVLNTGHRLFKDMSSAANLVNGTINIPDNATLDCAVAEKNEGTIERVKVTTSGELTTAKATVAGLVKENHGTIYQCSSTLPVYGTDGYSNGVDGDSKKYIGGIAAVSTSKDAASLAVIDACSVNASVNGTDVYGGGVVGYVTGRVSNNTYEYGITVNQTVNQFKNIFAQAGTAEVRATGNAWPTTALNYIHEDDKTTNPNGYTGKKYDAVLDCQAELHALMMGGQYNKLGKVYRISKSFTVSSSANEEDDWSHGTIAADNTSYDNLNNVSFTLEGNSKTITLTGDKTVKTTNGSNLSDGEATNYTTAPMLFNYVLGEVKNLNLYLEKPLVASPTEATDSKTGEKTYNAEDAIAPLAYGVYGPEAKLTNVKVTGKTDAATPADNAYVQASTPAGLVVWAYGGATITSCTVGVPVRMWLPSDMGTDAKHYAGGVVACAAKANILQTSYTGSDENSVSGSDYSTTAKNSGNYFYGGIVGGTSTKNGDTPELVIKDCSSWFVAKRATAESTDRSSKGGIIGYCCYADSDSGSTIKNGMKEGNEGNWWQLSAVGAHTWLSGLNEEKVIGKRNSITPSAP